MTDSEWVRSLSHSGEHSYHRRAFNHDYYAPFIYHIILKKTASCEVFGHLTGDARIAPGLPGCADIDESDLGKTISKTILHLPYEYPIIKLYQFRVMPDHVHILLQVLFRSEYHLDFYIDTLKKMIITRYSTTCSKDITEEDVFEIGYCDKPLYDNRSLDALYTYIRENPHRLAARRQFPQFFQRIRKLNIGTGEYEAYGNLFLFRNPDKSAVKISRRFTNDEKQRKRANWIEASVKGTILVSPFISQDERDIRAEAENTGGNIILIVHEAFPERYKPMAHDFKLCTEGRLLIISLGIPIGTKLSRTICMRMNALAAELATQ